VKRPGGEGAGTHVDRTVQLADILATLVDYVHPDRAPTLPGTSLFHDPDGAIERAAFAHLDLDGHLADAVVEGGWTLIATPDGYELFDRVADPGEQHDVAGEHPVIVGYLATLLADHVASTPRAPSARSAVIPDDVRQNLRALGYVQ
jgi:arylsulfatase A-like enzyme